ncbi:MAG: hypothetical protein NZ805_07050 [Armatimonadetes bacterium]|nr:hypothetical protein [Armatimonadota bacterium]
MNNFGLICGFDVKTANVYDASFRPLIEKFRGKKIVLTDSHFHSRDGKDPEKMKICKRGRWNERMLVETVFSMMARVFKFKKVTDRVREYFKMRVAFRMAAFKLLAIWIGLKADDKGFVRLSIAEFCL